MIQPRLHEPFLINSRVKLSHHFSQDKKTPIFGTIAGIASMDVSFTYIILLDKPIEVSYVCGPNQVTAVAVNGTQLELVKETD